MARTADARTAASPSRSLSGVVAASALAYACERYRNSSTACRTTRGGVGNNFHFADRPGQDEMNNAV